VLRATSCSAASTRSDGSFEPGGRAPVVIASRRSRATRRLG